jgi:hypothetical protein
VLDIELTNPRFDEVQRVQRYKTEYLLHVISSVPFHYDVDTFRLYVAELEMRGVIGHSDNLYDAYLTVGGRAPNGILIQAIGSHNAGSQA